jgi:hypothetical protein
MKRLRPLLLLTVLFSTSSGGGACGGRSLGKPDGGDGGPRTDGDTAGGCRYNGVTYASGASFPAEDGCNSCTCGGGSVGCTKRGCVSDGGSTGIVACNDGTGATDCCAATSTTGTCSNEGLTCWTTCSFPSPDATEGYQGQKFCSGGQWGSGHGLFPCSRKAPDETIACNDGTGATNCCPTSAIVDTPCSAEGSIYRTACMPTINGGYQTQQFCKGGRWAGGLGLLACGKPISDGGSGDASFFCTPGADQTCNDDPSVSSLWGHCEAGICVCRVGRSINPATGRCRLAPVVDAAASTSN